MQVQERKTVGARELKTRLGTYLRQVQTGATLIVTERGRPVAELRPLVEDTTYTLDARLRELVSLGIVSGETPAKPFLEPFQPIRSHGGSLSEAIIEDREDRI